jgi:thiamine biosynthesis lipoprotein
MMTLANRLAFSLILLIFSCSSPQKEIVSIKGNTMGTTYNVKFLPVTNNPIEIEENYIIIEKILKDINQQMSTYIPSSEISTFNQLQSTDWFKISEDFGNVLKKSFNYYEMSDGHYDITVMPLVNLWGFGPEIFESPPTQALIDSVMIFIGQDLIELENQKIRKKDPRVQIDLSSIAKGYAVDKIFNTLNKYEDLFIEIGGEIRTRSKNKDWKIGINTPSITNFENDIELVITLNNLSIATSGNYRNFYIIDDKFYHHEINPKTGYPISSNLGSISIISDKSCLDADGLSTMFYTIEKDLARDMVENLDNIESLSIIVNSDKTFTKVSSSNFPKN